MIITRTAYRISFLGGGTDYYQWYLKQGGVIFNATIDKYVYISVRFLPKDNSKKYHIIAPTYVEKLNNINDISNRAIKLILQQLNIQHKLEICYVHTLPTKSGIATSSAFVVGLINALAVLYNYKLNKLNLACAAIYVEKILMGDKGGIQDQIAIAYGGMNRINLDRENKFNVFSLALNKKKKQNFANYLLLGYANILRSNADIANKKGENISKKQDNLQAVKELAPEAIQILCEQNNIEDLGRIFHKAWELKKDLCKHVTNIEIDNLYQNALKYGAIGGKLLGSGGGGFFLLFADPKKHRFIRNKLRDIQFISFKFENNGSQIVNSSYIFNIKDFLANCPQNNFSQKSDLKLNDNIFLMDKLPNFNK